MLIVLFFICILLIVLGVWIYATDEAIGFAVGAIGLISVIAILIIGSIMLNTHVLAKTYDTKITMYKEENSRIEKSISTMVENYMAYEKQTFATLSATNIDTKDVVALVSLFPRLASDTLVKSQIETMVSNNQEIKKLKESLIDSKVVDWWLYFAPIK